VRVCYAVLTQARAGFQIPIKFVFELLDYNVLSSSQEFKDLLALAKR